MQPAVPDVVGSVIADRYVVLCMLGKGQHGEVYRVHDTHLDGVYALKLLEPNQIEGPWHEARLLNTLSGDFIVCVRNADTTPDGTRYLVTDVAEHGTVADRLDGALGIPEDQAVRWMREACNGLARVHRHGLLHRDIKPDNLFLTESGGCLIGDLSLAGQQDEHGYASAGGSLETMAPEVAAVDSEGYSGKVNVYDVRSEVFSLGATLYWLLAGTPAITGTRYRDAASTTPSDLWELAPQISRGTRDIVMRCLSSDPHDRYQDPAALSAALGRRTSRPREWRRIPLHAGHEQCFEGLGRGAPVQMCVLRGDRGDTYTVIIAYAESGRRHAQSGATATGLTLNRVLRRSIRSIA